MLNRLFEKRDDRVQQMLVSRGLVPMSSVSSSISEKESLAHSAVWSCVWLIADLLSTLPLKVYRTAGGKAVELPTTPSLFSSPSIEVSPIDWVSQHVTSLLMRGNAYGVVTSRDSMGWPTSIENVSPDVVRVSRDDKGKRTYRIGTRTVDASEVFHVIGRPWAGLPFGLSVIEYAARNIRLGLSTEKFGSDFFDSGGHPTGVLSTERDVSSEQAEAVKDRFVTATSGRGVVVLGQDLKYSPLQITPNESQFLETIAASDVTVARWFGVPPELIAAASSGQSITYANLNDRMRSLLIFALNPWLARLEYAYTTLLPRPQYVKFTTGGMLRADITTRYAAYKTGIDAGFLTVDEVRAYEDLPPIGGQ